MAVCAPRGRSQSGVWRLQLPKRKLRARSHWPTGCGQETVVDSKPRGIKTWLPKAFVKWLGLRNDPGLGATPGMWPRRLRMGKGQDRPCSAALPGFCSPEPDSSPQMHLIEEVCVQCFGNQSLFLPAEPPAAPRAVPGAPWGQDPPGAELETLWVSSAQLSLPGSAGLSLRGFSSPAPALAQGLATRTPQDVLWGSSWCGGSSAPSPALTEAGSCSPHLLKAGIPPNIPPRTSWGPQGSPWASSDH